MLELIPSSTQSGRQRIKHRVTVGLAGLMVLTGTGNVLVPKSIASDLSPSLQRSLTIQQAALPPGQVSVTGRNGQYKGQVLIQASPEVAWDVITDYDNFKNFLPDLEDSRMISTQGNQTVYEQVNVFRVLAFTKKARVRLAATETYPKQVSFKVVQGNVKSLQGTWTLTSPAPGQVLVQHEVTVVPKDSDNKTLFFGVYKNSLKKTIAAIHKEVERRSQ